MKLTKTKLLGMKQNVEEFIKSNTKAIAGVVVGVLLIVACASSITARAASKNNTVGIMMTLSDVAENTKPFYGNSFKKEAITYEAMIAGNYEAEQLARIEKSEKRIEEILSSRNNQDKRDQAALQLLTAAEKEDSITTVVVAGPSVAPTFVDDYGSYQYVGEFVLTGYCPCAICCGAYSNPSNPITASGTVAAAGRTVAADTSVFPFFTELAINGQKYVVEDRGGAIRGNRIDIFFSSHQEALVFGKRTASVYKKVQ